MTVTREYIRDRRQKGAHTVTSSMAMIDDSGEDPFTAKEALPPLSGEHFPALIRGGIDAGVIVERGYASLCRDSVEHAELMHRERFSGPHRGSLAASGGLLIPVYNPTGERVSAHYRPDTEYIGADGKVRKYLTPFGVGTVLDVHPRNHLGIRDVSVPLYVTEGVKKGDALTSLGLCAVALSGVWNWKQEKAAHPDWDSIPCKGRRVVIVYDADAATNPDVLKAQAALGRWLRDTKLADVRVAILPGVVNDVKVKGVDDHFVQGFTLDDLHACCTEVIPDAKDTVKVREATVVNDATYEVRDTPLSGVVAECLMRDRYLYTGALGWLTWEECRWALCDGDQVLTHEVATFLEERFNTLVSEMVSTGELGTKAGVAKIATYQIMLNKSKVDSVRDLARGHGAVAVKAAEFDSDPDVVNTPDGMLDLRTGDVTPVTPASRVMRMTRVAYTPGARHADWDKALTALPDQETRDWFQLRMGQALTGHRVPDGVMVVMTGLGENGKSAVLDAISNAVGDYGSMLPAKTLLGNKNDHSTEKMALKGVRFAYMEETPEGRHLDVTTLKQIMDTARIKGRFMRMDNFEFETTHSLFVTTNYDLVVSETDHGTWRRLARLRFPFKFLKEWETPKNPNDRIGDPTLKQRVTYGHSAQRAVMAWLVEGAMKWYALNRIMPQPPRSVVESTREWRAESDVLMEFAAERIVPDTAAHIPSLDLLEALNDHLKRREMSAWSPKLLSGRVKGHDGFNGVEIKSIMKGLEGLSRPEGTMSPLPARYQAYTCIRFRRPGDPYIEDGVASGGGTPPDAPGPVTPPADDPGDPFTLPTVNAPDSPDDVETEHTHTTVAFDIETPDADTLFTHDTATQGPFARLCGYRVNDSEVVTTVDADELIKVLSDANEITGHNILAYDLVALAVHHGADYGHLAAKAHDTLLIAKQIDPPAARAKGKATDKYDLDTLALRLVGIGKQGDGKALAKEWGGWGEIPVDDPAYVTYLRGDVNASAAIRPLLPATDYTDREHRFTAITSQSRMKGVRIDVPLCRERAEAEDVQRRDALSELSRVYGLPLSRVKEFKRKPSEVEVFKSPLGTTEGGDWFKGLWDRFIPNGGHRHAIVPVTDGGAPSMKGNLLKGVMDMPSCPEELRHALDLVCTANGARVVYSTVLKFVTPDGRVHPQISAEQSSGRLSIRKPGLSVFGKHGGRVRERGIVVADDGRVLVAFDFDQIDARGIAAHSQDHGYMDLFEGDLDFHTANAVALFGDAGMREMAKKGGHGANYGMGVAGMVKLGVPREMAIAFLAAQEERFPTMCGWRKGIREIAATGALLDNGLGRKMRPDPERAWTQGPALMGQGTTRDLMVSAILRLSPELQGHLLYTIHDELLFNLPEDRADELSEEIMSAMTFDWAPPGAERRIHISCGRSAAARDWASCYA